MAYLTDSPVQHNYYNSSCLSHLELSSILLLDVPLTHLILNVQNNTSVLKKKGNPDRKKNCGRGKHQKAWKQEIRREHNSNPLQRHEHRASADYEIQCIMLHITHSNASESVHMHLISGFHSLHKYTL